MASSITGEADFMNWMKENLEKRRLDEDRAGRIENAAPEVWKNLHAAITRSIADYGDGGGRSEKVEVSKLEHHSFSVTLMKTNRHTNPSIINQASIELHKNVIKVTYNSGRDSLELPLDLNETGQVCLMYQGEEITTERASQAILERMLFSDLHLSKP